MQYNGQELEEITEPQLVNPPKEMLVWNSEGGGVYRLAVHTIVGGKNCDYPVITTFDRFRHCAKIPEPKPVTYRELSQWLVEGNGEWRLTNLMKMARTSLSYDESVASNPVDDFVLVRKWEDSEWVSPTREYLGLEG